MSRLFLTNIDLNTNELQNAVIQNLSSAPTSGNTEGRIYYDSTRKTLRVWRNDSLQGSKWYDLSVGGASASTVTLTGDVTGSASVDPTTGIITVATTLNVSGTENQITVQDIDNVTTISLPSLVVIDNGEIQIQKTSYWRNGSQQGVIAAQSDGSLRLTALGGGLQLETNSGDVQINPSTGLTSFNNGNGEAQLQKTSYWRDGTQQGVIAAQSDGSLRLTGISNGLQLESNNGDIKINSASGTTYFNNNIYINSEGTIATESGAITLAPDNGRVDIHASTTVFGGNGDAFVRFQDANGNDVVKITSGLASDESYHGYNDYVNTKVIDFNGFIKLSSENNPATGFLFVNAQTAANEAAPTLHLESNGDLALRAGANGNEGNIILYTGETSSGQPGKAYIGWGNSRYGADAQAEIATIGTEQIFSNKTLQSPTINGPIGIRSGGGANGATIDVDNNTGTTTITGNNGDITIVSDNNLNVTAGLSTFTGSVSITGDLNVQGTLTAINKQEIDITDNTIVLNSNFTSGVPSQDAAVQVKRGSANTVGIVWSEGNQDWTLTNDGNHYFGIARKAVFAIGDASNTSFDVVHNLGTQDITVAVRMNNADYELVETDVKMKDANTVTIAFTDAPALNAYKVIIIG